MSPCDTRGFVYSTVWCRSRWLTWVEYLPSVEASLIPSPIHDPDKTTGASPSRSEPWHRTVLHIHYTPICHTNPPIAAPHSGIGSLRLPPTVAKWATWNGTATLPGSREVGPSQR